MVADLLRPFPARELGTGWGDGPAQRDLNTDLFIGNFPAYFVGFTPWTATWVIDCREPVRLEPHRLRGPGPYDAFRYAT